MQEITLTIEVKCVDHQHQEISTLLKTIGHTLDVAIEGKDEANEVHYQVDGAHPDSITNTQAEIAGGRGKGAELRKAIGL